MKKLHILIVLFYISQIAFSQTDFRPGFIINKDQDTIFGLIKYKEGNTSNHNCQFRASATEETATYKAEDISGYGFKNDKVFKSKKIITSDQNSEFALLEVLISGKATLYKYENIFYLEKADQELTMLTNKSKQTIDGKEIVVETKTYLGLLNLFLSDSPAMNQERIYRTVFSEKALTDLIESYNISMNSSQVIYKDRKPWIKAKVGIAGGLINSQLTITSNNHTLDHMGPFKRANSPAIVTSIELQSPRINERFSIIANIMFNKSKYISHNEHVFGGTTSINDVTIDMTHLRIPFGIKYTFKSKGMSAYLNAGLSDMFNLSSKSNWIQTLKFITLYTTIENEALEITKNQLGVWGGAGLTAPLGKGPHAYIEFRYEKQRGINAIDFVELDRSDVINFQFIIGLTSR